MDENTDLPIIGPLPAAEPEPQSGESAQIERDWVGILRYMAEEYARIAGDLDQLGEWLHEVAEDYNKPELEQLFQVGPLRTQLVLLAGGTLVDVFVLQRERAEEAERERRMGLSASAGGDRRSRS